MKALRAGLRPIRSVYRYWRPNAAQDCPLCKKRMRYVRLHPHMRHAHGEAAVKRWTAKMHTQIEKALNRVWRESL